ncbi:hypothetical protein ABTM51_20670, partial [Acinetobacter baumannii]
MRDELQRMSSSAGASLSEFYDRRLVIAPIGFDHFADVRNLHASALREGAASVLSETELDTLLNLLKSPRYSDLLLQEEIYG